MDNPTSLDRLKQDLSDAVQVADEAARSWQAKQDSRQAEFCQGIASGLRSALYRMALWQA